MRPETERVRIERMVHGGSGLARLVSGELLFVPFSLSGEDVEIERPETGDEARLLRVLKPAATRTAPCCPHFGTCGGCQYQHADYAAQLEIKQEILIETMQRARVEVLPPIEVHAGEPWQYRNRVRFRVASVNGEVRVGYSLRSSNQFLPIAECPIAAPLLWSAATALLQVAKTDTDARLWLQAAVEIELFANSDLTQLQLTLFCANKLPAKKESFAHMCEALRQELPELAGAGVARKDARGMIADVVESWGASGLSYRVAQESYWVSRGGFFQVNRFLVERLVRLVCEGRSGTIAWDLFAGVGLFSRVLARSFTSVTAVEANPVAANDLRVSLAKSGAQHHAVQASTLHFLGGAVLQRERPELIVLDPPRAGAGLEACALLLRVAARAIVYVSCDPVTLARDLVALQRGYKITAMHLVDLFPQTFHLETVVVLEAK